MLEESIPMGKLGEIANTLEDVHAYLHQQFVLLPIEKLPLILEAMVNSSKSYLRIYFTLGYFGIKRQLDEEIRQDVCLQMHSFMQWGRKEVRKHYHILKLLDLGQIYMQNNYTNEANKVIKETLSLDPDNRIALIAMAGISKALGDPIEARHYFKKYEHIKNNPPKPIIVEDSHAELERFIRIIQKGKPRLEQLLSRSLYKKMLSSTEGVLELMWAILLKMVTRFDKNHTFSIKDLQIMVKDLLFLLTDRLSIMAGIIYYIMKGETASDDIRQIMLDQLKTIIGFDQHKEIEGMEDAFFVEYEKEKILNEIQRLEAKSMHATQTRHQSYDDLIEIDLKHNDYGFPSFFHVRDYEDKELRNKMIASHEKVIKNKKITIFFAYPLTNPVSIEYENLKGFTRMDLFKCIFEGYSKIYSEEEAEVGDPGFWKYGMNRARSYGKYGVWNHYIDDLVIERVLYSPSKGMVELFIGS